MNYKPVINFDTNLIQRETYRFFNLNNLKSEEASFLAQKNISLDCLKNICQEYLFAQENYHGDQTKEIVKEFTGIQTQFSGYTSKRTIHQRWLLKFKKTLALCPWTGKILTSDRAFCLNSFFTFYHFFGNKGTFYILSGYDIFVRFAVYFPQFEVVCSLGGNLNQKQVTNLINTLKISLKRCQNQVDSYLNITEEKNLFTIVGFRENVAHGFWNDLFGIEILSQTGTLHNIDRFIVGLNEYFGKLEEIFPEIDPNKIIRLDKHHNIFEYCLQFNAIPLRFCNENNLITEEFATKIHQISLSKCSESTLKIIQEAKNCFPLIWIDIRLRKRTWVSQFDGLAKIIEKLSNTFPKLGIVFQGMALPDFPLNHPSMASKITLVEEENREVTKLIDSSSLPDSVKVYNRIGCSMFESIVWSHEIDFYVAPWGAGLTRLTLIANKPGIIHTNKYNLQDWVLKDRWFNSSQRENGISPSFVPVDCITNIEEDVDDPHHASYDCDYLTIYDEIIKLISKIEIRNKS